MTTRISSERINEILDTLNSWERDPERDDSTLYMDIVEHLSEYDMAKTDEAYSQDDDTHYVLDDGTILVWDGISEWNEHYMTWDEVMRAKAEA